VAAGVAAAIDRPGTVRHGSSTHSKTFGNNESTHGVRYLGKENSENMDIYYKNWGSGRPVVNGNSQDDGRMFSVVERKKGNP
jgi:hypothetical protein